MNQPDRQLTYAYSNVDNSWVKDELSNSLPPSSVSLKDRLES
jgi:hypothetical protein